MKKYLYLFVIGFLFTLCTNAQTINAENRTRYSDTTRVIVSVDLESSKLKLPVQDVGTIYSQIDRLQSANKTEYEAISARLETLDSKIGNITYQESDAKLEYISSNFNITKEQMSTAILRSSINNLVAILIPIILLVVVWVRLFNVRNLEAYHAILYILLGLIAAIATGFCIKYGLEALFNHNMAILKELQNLL